MSSGLPRASLRPQFGFDQQLVGAAPKTAR